MTEKLRSILAELRQRFEAIYGGRLVKMILFGSQARGDAEPESDIDVLVVLKGEVSAWEEIQRISEDRFDLSLEHSVGISCVFVSKDEYERERSPLMLNIAREGVAM